jgi:hypothetical protein
VYKTRIKVYSDLYKTIELEASLSERIVWGQGPVLLGGEVQGNKVAYYARVSGPGMWVQINSSGAVGVAWSPEGELVNIGQYTWKETETSVEVTPNLLVPRVTTAHTFRFEGDFTDFYNGQVTLKIGTTVTYHNERVIAGGTAVVAGSAVVYDAITGCSLNYGLAPLAGPLGPNPLLEPRSY